MAKTQEFQSFDDLLQQSPKPVLVDFYATWCGPCRMLSPILSQVQTLLKDKIQVVKIDTDKYPDLAQKFSVHALPTLVLFKAGVPVHRLEGVAPAEKIIEQLSPLL
ncbi:thioredoxin [Lyngbya confervoides]|uniref:Thioredoxin n=1 Tax=Lyngbya confervoides BDU141951 TaxID=1574623 RepID=A0ABD4T4W0_9CYAN|nr:thioredoxin [Lyngbya confervoides]MCM1983554.1 thioredoxin [Lyngbya confervoides BDU141951]